jgi:dTMP kinase
MIADVAALSFQAPKGFLVLEGVNGAGKSTLLKRLKAYAESLGFEVLTTFEPGATPQGKELRRILLEGAPSKVAPLSELFLFAADRHEHVQQVINPALASRKLVLCDRYLYSTLAFQGYGRGLNRSTINQLNSLAVGQTLPDLVLLLDLDAKEGLRRTKTRAGSSAATVDSFEAEELSFHEALRKGFLEIAKEREEPFLILDAAKSPDQVYETASAALKALLEKLEQSL